MLKTNTLFFFNVVEGVGVAIPVVGGGVGVVRTLSRPRFNSALRFDSSLLHLIEIIWIEHLCIVSVDYIYVDCCTLGIDKFG